MSPEPAATRRVGLTVVAALAVAAFAVMMIGDRQNLFASKTGYFVRFATVNGLAVGSDVRLNGVTVGSVREIVLPQDMGETLLEVRITVDSRFEQRIRRDSIARIKTLGLLGDKYIELISGSPAAEPIPEGGEIPAAPQTNVEQLTAAGEDVMNNIVTISAQLSRILGRMERGEGLLGELSLDADPDRKLSTELLDTLAALRQAAVTIESGRGAVPRLLNDPALADKLEGSIDRIDGLLARAEEGQGLLPALLDDEQARARFDRTLANLEEATARLSSAAGKIDTGDALLARMMNDEAWGREVADELKALITNLRELTDKLNRGEGTLGRLIVDPSIAEAIEDIVVGIDESRFLRWLVRNRQKEGIEKRYEEAQREQGEPEKD